MAGGELVGTVLQDSYRVVRLIGQGGMGSVYEATQLRLNKRVAIKVLAREHASNEEALARFRREAEVTSQLGHPHIVQVNDFGTSPSGEPYLAMEFLEGEDLDRRIRRLRRFSVADTTAIVKQIASALSSTHARGIVHRDLKPANVFLMEVDGEADFVKIVDFGISKVRAATLRLTNASAVVGTPNYMSPEQASGQVDQVDHRTDQWSLACIAYEMLAGRGPFLGESIQSLLYQVVHQEPPALASLNPGVPPELAKVVARAMAKAKDDRFPTVNAFLRAFVAAAATAPAPAEVSLLDGARVTPVTATDHPAAADAAPPSGPGGTRLLHPQAPAATQALPLPEGPAPQPTTLSRTASELAGTSRRRGLTSRWALVGGGAGVLAVVVVLGVLIRAKGGGSDRPVTVSPGGESARPVVMPLSAGPPAPVPAAPPPQAAPPPAAALPPPAPTAPQPKSKRSSSARGPKTPAAPTSKVPPATSRRGIIEEL